MKWKCRGCKVRATIHFKQCPLCGCHVFTPANTEPELKSIKIETQ